MAAGLGYKEFSTGDVLTAADANGYLASQVVMVFADAAARTSAIASPQEGMISYLKDTNSTEYYSGSAWAAIGGSAATFKGASAYRSSSQTISNNTATAMLLDTELFDTDGFHSTSTNTSRFTIPAGLGGKYLVNGSMAFESNGTGKRIMNISVNGSTVRWSNQVAGNASVLVGNEVTSIVSLSVGDYVEFFVLQDSGGSRLTNSGSSDQWFQIQYLGA